MCKKTPGQEIKTNHLNKQAFLGSVGNVAQNGTLFQPSSWKIRIGMMPCHRARLGR